MTDFSLLPQVVDSALGGMAQTMTLFHQAAPVSDGKGGWSDPAPEQFAVKGFVVDFDNRDRLAGIPENDRKILLLAVSLAVFPRRGDRIRVEAQEFRIVRVERDPAGATFTLQVRR